MTLYYIYTRYFSCKKEENKLLNVSLVGGGWRHLETAAEDRASEATTGLILIVVGLSGIVGVVVPLVKTTSSISVSAKVVAVRVRVRVKLAKGHATTTLVVISTKLLPLEILLIVKTTPVSSDIVTVIIIISETVVTVVEIATVVTKRAVSTIVIVLESVVSTPKGVSTKRVTLILSVVKVALVSERISSIVGVSKRVVGKVII